jgi:DinB family protein
MTETFDEYKKRLLGYLGKQNPLRVQKATPDRIARLLKGRPKTQLLRRPARGKWSVAEIIAHLADDELVGGYRIRMILESPGTTLYSFDQEKWASAGKYEKRDPVNSLELFRVLRKANLDLLQSLTPAHWKLHGMHTERGVETIAGMFELNAGHDLNHLRQIKAILG